MLPAPTLEQLPAAARRHLAAGESQLIYHPYSTATWRVERPSGAVLYLKAAPAGFYPSLASERDRCGWLADRGAPVPHVVEYGGAEDVEWLLTAALGGAPATAEPHLRAPKRTVGILGEGLRAFHEIDRTGCPFDHTIAASLRHVSTRVAAGQVDAGEFDAPHGHMDASQALQRLLDTAPAEEDLVVSHGDYCFPNALIEGGRVVGYLDVGEAGVADRWRDLAVATWSVTWNVGPGFEDQLLEAYGADWDLERRDFFRLLYELES